MTRFMYKNINCGDKLFTITVELRYKTENNRVYHKVSIKDLGYSMYKREGLAQNHELEHLINTISEEARLAFTENSENKRELDLLTSLGFSI